MALQINISEINDMFGPHSTFHLGTLLVSFFQPRERLIFRVLSIARQHASQRGGGGQVVSLAADGGSGRKHFLSFSVVRFAWTQDRFWRLAAKNETNKPAKKHARASHVDVTRLLAAKQTV